MFFPVKSLTKQKLDAIANPQAVGQPEAIAWDFYDTQLYVDAVTTQLTFFQTTSTDPSISNMQNAGQLPDPQYFRWYYGFLDVLRQPTVTSVAAPDQLVPGAIDDIDNLIKDSRPTWTFNLQDKRYGPFPLSRLHGSGGAVGFATAVGTVTAENVSRYEYGQNSVPSSTWCWDGSIVISPKVGFSIVLDWPAAVNLTADMNLRFIMSGVLFRAVR